jgi:hypothetical protein
MINTNPNRYCLQLRSRLAHKHEEAPNEYHAITPLNRLTKINGMLDINTKLRMAN